MKEEIRESSFVKIKRGPEARIALCKCGESRKIYGVRMERAQVGWNYTWAFPISESAAKREGYDATVLKGNISMAPGYNGCPYCGTKGFGICSSCMRLSCNINITNYFTCEWCGYGGPVVEYDGQGIQSGGDR